MPGPKIDSKTLADTGCDLAPSCLNCPLPACRYDAPGQVEMRAERDRLIWDMRQLGMKRTALAQKFGVRLRTVDWAIARKGAPPPQPRPKPERPPVYRQRAPLPALPIKAVSS